MDAVIICGTIPTLWPLMKMASSKFMSSSKDFAPYDNIRNAPDEEYGTEPFQLSDERPKRKAGPATRALEELDNMRTTITVRGAD